MKLREWKDIIYGKMKEHKKQTVIVLVVFLFAVSGTGLGIYYGALSDQAVSTVKEEQREKKKDTKTPKEKTEDAKTPEEKKEMGKPEATEKAQETEEQKGTEEQKDKEEKEDAATKSNQIQESPSKTSGKSSGQTQQPSQQQKPQQPSKKPDPSKPSGTSSQPEKPANKPSEPSSQPEQPAKPSHTHNWVAQTTTKQHPAEGHNETVWVQDSAAWDEPIYESRAICNKCGADCSEDPGWHSIQCGGSYSVKEVQVGTKNHPATGHNETKWVQDKAAWTETITTGYKCSCGATK